MRSRTAALASRGAAGGEAEGRLLIEGQVVGPDGAGVGGASVFLTGPAPRRVVSESDGSFVFDRLADRTYAVTATAGSLIGGPVAVRPAAESDPVVVRLAAGAALAIRVADERGQPVPAARIALEDPTGRAATTDDSGAAVLRPVHVGPVGVSVSAAGFATATAMTSVAATEAASELAITLHEGFAASGRVIDDQGSPIAGAEVQVAGAGGVRGDAERVETDGDGRFTVSGLAAGAHTLVAHDGEHAPAESRSFAIADRAVSGLEIAMPPGGVIAGEVVASDGAPAPSATVRLVSRATAASTTFVRETRCDEHGRFEARGVPRASVQVQAEAEAASSDAVDVDLIAAPAARSIKLIVETGGVISGVVVDASAQPLPEVQVTAYGDGPRSAAGSTGPSAATTDGAGAFSLRGVRAGAYRLYATGGPGGLRNPEGGTAATSGARGVRIALVAAGGLRGNLRIAGGAAPERAFVQVGDQPALPVTDGRFAIDGVTPGIQDVTWRGPGFPDVVRRGVVIEAGKVTDLGTVEAGRGRTLRGRVVDEHGAPVAGAQVQVGPSTMTADAMSSARSATSDRDGAFTITGLPASAASVSAGHAVRGRSTALAIDDGDRDPPAAVLVLRRHGSVAGTIAPQGGAGNATVTLAPEGGGPPLVTRAAEDGAFSFAEVPEGVYLVTATRSSAANARQSASATVRVTSGQRASVAIEMPHGAIRLAVELRGAGAAGEDIAVALFRGEVAAATEAELAQALRQGSLQGTTTWRGTPPSPAFDQLAPGRYSVCAAGAGRIACKQVELLPSVAQQTVVHDLASSAPTTGGMNVASGGSTR